jgi:uncharacterized protein
MGLTFEWSRRKASSNLRRHGVGFEEAMTVFNNPLTAIFDDQDHSTDEERREIAIGHSARDCLLVVSFLERMPEVVRIISARPATKKERRNYEENAAF